MRHTIHYSVTSCNVPLFFVTPVICFVMDKMQEKNIQTKACDTYIFGTHLFILVKLISTRQNVFNILCAHISFRN